MAVNDLAPADELVYLLKHDSVYGRYGRDVRAEKSRLVVNGHSCAALNENSVDKLPWRDLAVDIVLECTGVFTKEADLKRHLEAGATYVILSAPVEGGDVPTVVHGVNSAAGRASVISCASCTTNCITPVIEILGRRLGVLKATMTTTHAYTATQALVDRPGKITAGDVRQPSTWSIDDRGGEGHDQGPPRIPREVRRRGDPGAGTRRVDRGHRASWWRGRPVPMKSIIFREEARARATGTSSACPTRRSSRRTSSRTRERRSSLHPDPGRRR